MDIEVCIKNINLLLSNKCNLHCKMCDYTLEASKRRELTDDEVCKLIKESVEIGLERLDLSGGEPMMRTDVYDIIAYAKSYGIRTLLVTNGTLIGQDEAQKLVNSGLSAVIISMEGFEEINDLIRGKGSFKKAIQAINEMKKYSERLDYINVGITISKLNFKELFNFTKYLIEEIGVTSVSYNPFDGKMLQDENYNGVKDLFYIYPEDMAELKTELGNIIDYSKRTKANLTPDFFLGKIPDYFTGERAIPKYPCCAPLTSCTVNAAGDVFGCWGQAKVPAGNCATASLEDIIQSERYLETCICALTLKCPGCLKACYVNVHNEEY